MAAHLVIMSKAPQMGRVKTRLAHDRGAVEALRFYRMMVGEHIRRLGADPRWRTWLAVTPDTAVRGRGFCAQGFWPPAFPRLAQGPGDLGQRMTRVMHVLPPGPVIIIGTDTPALEGAHIAAGFRALGCHDAVFGPARDGGYWLVGLKRFPRVPDIFSGVRWSTPYALADTCASLDQARVAMLEERDDIDTGADYQRWMNKQKPERNAFSKGVLATVA